MARSGWLIVPGPSRSTAGRPVVDPRYEIRGAVAPAPEKELVAGRRLDEEAQVAAPGGGGAHQRERDVEEQVDGMIQPEVIGLVLRFRELHDEVELTLVQRG